MEWPASTKLLERVAWRLRLASLGRRFYIALLALGALYAVALLASRLTGLFPLPFDRMALAVLPAMASLIALIWHRRPKQADAARRVDQFEGTKDLFLTVSLLDSSAGGFQPLVVRDAEQQAASIHPAQVVPFQWTKRTAWGAAMSVALLAGVLFLPQLDPFGNVQASMTQQKKEQQLERAHRATQKKIAELRTKQDVSDGEESEAVKKAIDALKFALNSMKPQLKQENQQKLAVQQKEFGEKWKNTDAEQLKELLKQTPRNQQFGKSNQETLEKWTRELQEGSAETLRKEVDEMKEQLERLMAEKDPVQREEMVQQLKKKLKDLEELASERAGSKPLSAALDQAMQQLEMARSGEMSTEALEALQESLDLTQLELEQLAQSVKDLKSLEEALKVIQMAKKLNEGEKLDGEACKQCNGLSDYAELYEQMMAGAGMGGSIPGEGGSMGGPGIGEGGTAPEDDAAKTDFTAEKSQSPITAGKVLLSLKTKGLSDKGDAVRAYRDNLAEVKQGVSEALDQEQIPPGYHNGIKSYFDTIKVPDAEATLK